VLGEMVHVELDGSAPGAADLAGPSPLPGEPRWGRRATAPGRAGRGGGSGGCRGERLDRRSRGAGRQRRPARGDDDGFAYGARGALALTAPTYVELSRELEPRYIRIAGPAVRSYLATRAALTARDVVVAIVDEADRFYFIVARGVAFTRT
jgi:hypothetical protein